MPNTIRVQEIIDALQMQFDEQLQFLDLDSGEVEIVSKQVLNETEASDEMSDVPEWQEEEWELARRILSTDRFKKLPTQFEVHEWSIMEEFSHSVEAPRIREELLHAIHGSGAFRSFKDATRRHKIEKDWYAFRDEALRQIAIDWCEENGIAWE